jgi:hypothetical protein
LTRPVTFTQASINRAVKAARRSGLRVTGISADGVVLVQEMDVPLAIQNNLDKDAAPSKWGNVKA